MSQPSAVEIEIPDQSDFYKLPARFGALPLDEAPLGYEIETKRRETKVTKFEHAYPRIYLPFQEVKRESFGHGKKFSAEKLLKSELKADLRKDLNAAAVLRHHRHRLPRPILRIPKI